MQGKKSTKRDKKRFLEALSRRHGIVSLACKETGISNRTFYNWCDRDPEFAEQAEEIREIEIGIIAEDRMEERIKTAKTGNPEKFEFERVFSRWKNRAGTAETF